MRLFCGGREDSEGSCKKMGDDESRFDIGGFLLVIWGSVLLVGQGCHLFDSMTSFLSIVVCINKLDK